MPPKISLARYLFARLHQNHVHHVHGVPGDYTLKALDHLSASGVKWIGNCNELNAGYAADGYARIRGLAALFTTYGVGELSAINAVAGSYAEHVPVVHVIGTPARHLQASGAKVHHSLGDGRSRVFQEMHEKVTVAQANLIDAVTAPESIDRTIAQCLKHSRPVYIELPCDMVSAEVPTSRLEEAIIDANPTANELVEAKQARKLLNGLYGAKQPLCLVDRGDGVGHIKDQMNVLVERARIPTLTMPSGGGMVDHRLETYYGVHSGSVGKIDTMPFVRSSDLVLAFGPQFSDTQTLGWSLVPDPASTITIGKNTIDGVEVDTKRVLEKVVEMMDVSRVSRADTSSLGNFRTLEAPPADTDDLIDQDTLYLRLNDNGYLQPDDVVLLANATPILGGRDLVLPPRSRMIVSGMWFSIGHMLPAAQGAALAQQNKGRTILFEGDGSFQVSAQEISTIIRERLDVTIFLINNDGYAYERQIHGMHERYNDLGRWRYLEAARFFGADDAREYEVRNYKIKTWGDLDRLLAQKDFQHGRGLNMVEVIVGKFDVPALFRQVFKKAGEQL